MLLLILNGCRMKLVVFAGAGVVVVAACHMI